MLPAVANRFQPAVALMQSATTFQERMNRPDSQGLRIGQTPAQVAAPRDMKAVNELYFGSHLTVTEAMARLMDQVVGYLNDKLELGRDGSEEGKSAGNEWRRTALRDYVEVGAEGDFSLPEPGNNGVTYQQVARMIQDKFDVGILSRDRTLMKEIEQAVGFKLDGMNVTDLLTAFVDPNSDAADKVRGVLSDGLAGQTGSKVRQRLERAAEGPKSVEETVADTRKSPVDEVDEETAQEDMEAVKAAKTLEKIEAAAELPKEVHKALDEMKEAGAAQGGARIAAAVLQALGNLNAGALDDKTRTDGADTIASALGDSADPAKEGKSDERPSLSPILQAYREAQENENGDEQKKRFLIAI